MTTIPAPCCGLSRLNPTGTPKIPAVQMSDQLIEDERRRGRMAGIAAIVGIVTFIASMGLAGDFNAADQAEQLKLFDSVKGDLLLQCLLQGLALLLFIPALVSLFRSVQARSSAIRPGLIGVVIAGPILLAGSLIITYFAFKGASQVFLAPGSGLDVNSNDVANDTFYEQFSTQMRTGLGLAGSLSLAFASIYLALNAMRTGLFPRFWGTLGMALGVGTLLFGSLMLIGYMLLITLVIAGWWPGARPPAWAAGEAIPWPKPGQPGDAQPDSKELASPDDFEGSATEVDPDARPGRRDNKRKRKRKQRG